MKVGLALSGGGARGIAHVGVLQALEEMDIQISLLSGTSMGAIVGALYAYGYRPQEILNIIREAPIFRFLNVAWSWTSLLSLNGLVKLLKQYMPRDNFHSLRIPLSVAATEIERSECHYLVSGQITSAVAASCAVPALFSPVKHCGGVYVDGGLLDNLPVKAIKYQVDFAIGSHCNPMNKEFRVSGSSFKAIVERSLVIAASVGAKQSRRLCDLFIEPPSLYRFSGFDMSKAQELFDIGYEFAKKHYAPRDFQKKIA